MSKISNTMPVNIRMQNLDYYKLDIPDIYFTEVTTALKTRVKQDQRKGWTRIVVAATSGGNLLIFNQQKLLKACKLPFSDCNKLLIYHSYQPRSIKEFLVAASVTKGAVVIDFQSLSIVKIWPDAKTVEVIDQNLLGSPQVVVHFSNDLVAVVTHQSDWEALFQDDCEPMEDDSAIKNVIEALETQLKNVHGNLHLIRKQISLRQTILNRSLAALNDAIVHTAKGINAPTYTIDLKCTEGQANLTSALELTENISSLIEPSGVWHLIDYVSDNWIVGTSFTNMSGRVLRDIQCFFILSNENTDYRICYYPTELEVPPNESKVLTDRETNNRFSDLLEMSIAFSGTLKPDCSLAIIVTLNIPNFISSTAEEIGDLFLTFKFSESPTKIYQLKLGYTCLNFSDICNKEMSFKSSTQDLSLLRRNVLGLISVLTAEEVIVLKTSVTSAFGCFEKALQQLNMQHLVPMQCFYCLGVYGHVFLLVIRTSSCLVHLKIRAQSKKKIWWFTQHLKSTLSDDCNIVPASSATVPKFVLPGNDLNFILSQLSIADIDKNDEVAVLEEPAKNTLDSVLDNVRKEFLKKHRKILGTSEEHQRFLKVPKEQYHLIQNSWFM